MTESRPRLGRRFYTVALAALLAACSGTASTRAPSVVPGSTMQPLAAATPSPTSRSTPAPTPSATPQPLLVGQAAVLDAMTRPGTLGLTLPAFIARWNTVLDQGQYPIRSTPERDGMTFTIYPEDATDTALSGVLNDDGTIRAVAALSSSKRKTPLVLYTTLGPLPGGNPAFSLVPCPSR